MSSDPPQIPAIDLSICIVTLNAADYLRDCLHSIAENVAPLQAEIIVVDNHSTDGTLEMLENEFAGVAVIRNNQNDGFARPMNQAMRQSQGRYLLLLNPDTLVHPGALQTLAQLLDDHPEVGICGPKVLNRDGTLQKPCRRGVSRPWATFSYVSGLSSLFPKSKFFGGYLLNYLDEDATHQVDGVAGSCMLVRRQVVDQVGYFDEQFFAYQEDADYCFQAQKAGWKIYYVPPARITHYGGQGGSRHQPYRSIYEWHRSYYLYYRKNLAADYFFLFNWFYYSLMFVKLLLTLLVNLLRKDKFAGPRRG
ncbi:MAG: glycosyltransferase family 2 protein [Anaerolineales bacterium]|nr:glycosyltransferase family 2 protein [Anaerolineales bacterium]